MGRADETAISATVQQDGQAAAQRRRVVVDVILLLTAGDKILLRERANTGYGDGAYEPPSGQLTDRETIVETAIRVARDEAGILIGPDNVSLAHVMHDVSGGGRIAFFLASSGWEGEPTSADVRWFPLWNLPTNMLDRARVALRNCADGMRFSTYPAFAPAASSRVNGFTMTNADPSPAVAPVRPAPAPWLETCGARLVGLPRRSRSSDRLRRLSWPAMAEILNAHGSRNDIFVTDLTPDDFASGAELGSFVRHLCDRTGAFGGDGIYFHDATLPVPQAWFFNPDGSAAEFCGNGMRCLGRVVLDRRGTDTAVIRSGQVEYTVRRGPATEEGVQQVVLEQPAVAFDVPVAAGRSPLIKAGLPELDPALTFTAVSVPNPHLVTVIEDYVEAGLVAMGERVAARRDVFPAGANLSVLLPLAAGEVFVRTYERGAGLTASCGSGMAASRAVSSRLGLAEPDDAVTVRNAGGVATVSLRVRLGRWHPVLQGNATFVYRADVDPAALARSVPVVAEDREFCSAEIAAYDALDRDNAVRLREAGIQASGTAQIT